jgi:mono/diheme cytochrome c family protein
VIRLDDLTRGEEDGAMSNQTRRRSERLRQQRRRQRVIAGVAAVAVVALIAVFAVVLQGGDDGPSGPALSDQAALGKELAVTRSCTGCHGRNGEGATGPKWIGLSGSTVTLVDGTTVVADRAYLAESIVDPNAKLVAGFGKMPQDSFSPAEVDALVQYIVELGEPAATG